MIGWPIDPLAQPLEKSVSARKVPSRRIHPTRSHSSALAPSPSSSPRSHLAMARLTVTASTMTTTTTATWLSLVLVLVFVVSVSAQQTYTLDVFDVPQTTISLRTAGVASIFNCSPSKTSTPTLAGGIRKLQLSAPAGTNTGNSVQLGVFIPNGQPTAPNGVQSANNNLKSPTFQVLYRLDGDTALCSLSSLNSQSQNPILRDVNNLNINLQTIGAYAFHFNALGDVVPNQVTVTMYSPTGVWMAQSNPITVVETGQNPTFSLFTLNFSDSTKWTSGSRFTGTVGAIELSWPEPANLQFAINQVQFLIAPTGSIGATVFVDCGCDGYHAGSGDRLEAGVVVKLSIGGTRCTSSTQSQMTSSTGTMVFSNLPGGCTYTLSVSGLNLCSNSPSSQAAQLGGSVNFAIQGTPGQLSIPPSTTVLCGSDTSPTATGAATIAGGTCAGATPSFTDMVTFPRCTAPGGTIQVISRAWSGAGSIQTQTITVADRKEISVSSWQQDVVIPCDASPTSAPSPTFTSCTAVGVAVSTQASNNCTLAGPCTAVTYKATDQCGNTASRTQYVVEDCASIVNCRFICDDDDPANPPTCSISVQGSLIITHSRYLSLTISCELSYSRLVVEYSIKHSTSVDELVPRDSRIRVEVEGQLGNRTAMQSNVVRRLVRLERQCDLAESASQPSHRRHPVESLGSMRAQDHPAP